MATAAAIVGGVAAIGGAVSDRNTAKDQIKEQGKSSASARAFVEEKTGQAREDILNLFPIAQQAREAGSQGALDIFGKSIPQQLGAFQQGNVSAQKQLIAGLPQIQNAILGLPVNTQAFQPQTIGVDPSLFQQQLPEFQQAVPILRRAEDKIAEDKAELLKAQEAATAAGISPAVQSGRLTQEQINQLSSVLQGGN